MHICVNREAYNYVKTINLHEKVEAWLCYVAAGDTSRFLWIKRKAMFSKV